MTDRLVDVYVKVGIEARRIKKRGKILVIGVGTNFQ